MQFYDLDRLDNRDPDKIEAAMAFVERWVVPYHRPVVHGVEHVPKGAALYVGNHNGGVYTIDSFLWALAVYRAHGMDALPFGLGHEVILSLPVVNQLLAPLGAVRASHDNAHGLFAAGKKALVYPGSDLDAFRPYRDRNKVIFGPRRGYMRLALRTGVPIVPVVSCGSHEVFMVLDDMQWLSKALGAGKWARIKVWPAVLSFPFGLTIGPAIPFIPLPVQITMEILEPMTFERSGPEAADDAAYVDECSDRVLAAMQASLTKLAAERKG